MNGTPRTRAYWHKRLKTGYRPTAADFADLVASFSLPGELPDPLPKRSAENLTNIPIPDPLPAVSGANLLNINPSDWRRVAVPPSYATATSLVLTGDYTAVLVPDLRVRVQLTDLTWAATEVKSASYDAGTNVTTVTLTSALPNNQLAILEYALIQPASAGGSVSRRTLGAYLNPVTAGTDAAFTVTGVTALVVNALYRVRAHVANAANATLNPDGLGALSIKRLDGANVAAGQIPANAEARLWYDGAAFILLNPAAPFRGALVYRSVDQSLPNDALVVVEWGQEAYDTDGFHSGGALPELVVPAGASEVLLTANVRFEAASVGIRQVAVERFIAGAWALSAPGLCMQRVKAANPGTTDVNLVSAALPVNSGNRFRLTVVQDSGVALALHWTNSWFAMRVLR